MEWLDLKQKKLKEIWLRLKVCLWKRVLPRCGVKYAPRRQNSTPLNPIITISAIQHRSDKTWAKKRVQIRVCLTHNWHLPMQWGFEWCVLSNGRNTANCLLTARARQYPRDLITRLQATKAVLAILRHWWGYKKLKWILIKT